MADEAQPKSGAGRLTTDNPNTTGEPPNNTAGNGAIRVNSESGDGTTAGGGGGGGGGVAGIGTTTNSGLTSQQKRAQNRKILAEDAEWNLASVVKLSQLCVEVVVANFQRKPALHGIPSKYRKKVLENISLDIPLQITAPLIPDDLYWKRMALAKFTNCDIARHGGTWKELFFEKHVQKEIEEFAPGVGDDVVLIREIKLAAPFVTKLRISQLKPAVLSAPPKAIDPPPDHLIMDSFMEELQRLKELDLYYGVKDCGMNFTWTSFGMTLPDCKSLSRALKAKNSLRSLVIRSSGIDNDRVLQLVTALTENKLITKIDLSHNKIGDIGAREFGKLLSIPAVSLAELNLGNNKIRHPGAQALGRALSRNTSLRHLDLRLNMIGDKGGVSLLNNLAPNRTLTHLNLSGNNLGPECVTALRNLLSSPDKSLHNLDISCNKLSGDKDPTIPGKELYETIKENRILTDFDVRLADVSDEIVNAIRIIATENRSNAFSV